MTTDSLFTRLDAEWPIFAGRRSNARHLKAWATNDEHLRRFATLDELVSYARTPGQPAASDEVLSSLAARSGEDDVAARTLLQAILFGLPRMARNFKPAAGDDPDEIAAVVVAIAYEKIRTYPHARRPRKIAANILLDTRQAVSRRLCKRGPVEIPTAEVLPLASVERTPAERLVLLVCEAVRSSRIKPADARIILLNRVLDVPADALAEENGCLPHSLRRRRLRAEANLSEASPCPA